MEGTEARPRESSIVREEVPVPAVSEEIWKLMLDRSKTAEMMIHTLRGEFWVVKIENGKPIGTWEQKGDPLMNERGIRFFSSFIFSAMSPDKLVTFLTEEEVNRLTLEMVETLIAIIAERGDEFQIPAANRSFVLRLLEQYYFINLTSSRKGTMLQTIKPTYERKEVYTPERKTSKWPSLSSFLG